MKYAEIVKSKTPTLVDFHAEWCGPCKAMSPVISKVANKVNGKARVIKVDIDKNPTLARKLKIQGVPTFLLYKEGKVVWRDSGMQSAQSLIHQIEANTTA